MTNFKPSQKVRVIKDIRNDGTCANCNRGSILVRKGEEGFIRELGEFLDMEVIFVHFIDEGKIIGCKRDELIILEDFDEDKGCWVKVSD